MEEEIHGGDSQGRKNGIVSFIIRGMCKLITDITSYSGTILCSSYVVPVDLDLSSRFKFSRLTLKFVLAIPTRNSYVGIPT